MASSLQDWLQIAYVLGAVQGTFLALILASRRRNVLPNRLLAATMLAFSADLAMAVYHESGTDLIYPKFIGLDFPIAFLYGPLLYLYVGSLVHGDRSVRPSALLHFLPFAALVLYMVPLYLQSPEVKLGILDGTVHGPATDVLKVVNPMKLVHGFTYIALILVTLRRHRMALKEELSYTERLNLAWLRNLMIAFVALAGVSGALYFANWQPDLPVIGMDPAGWYDDLTLLALTIFVYAIGYLGLSQPVIFQAVPERPETTGSEDEARPSPQYAKSGVDPETARAHLRALLSLMADGKPYRRGDLTLHDLAAALNISPHNLTEILNTQVGRSFYDFVNGYRVQEVRDRLENPAYKHWTILAIGLDAGFNSKSSFYSVFKKHTGLTPSEYLRSVSAAA